MLRTENVTDRKCYGQKMLRTENVTHLRLKPVSYFQAVLSTLEIIICLYSLAAQQSCEIATF